MCSSCMSDKLLDKVMGRVGSNWEIGINPFQPNVVFHIEISHLICTADQMTGFHMKRNWVKVPVSKNK